MKIKDLLVLIVLGSLVLMPAFAVPPEDKGNGAPNGPHWNLNIIGVPKGKTVIDDSNMGHRIFVPLWGKAYIWLVPGETFQVLDYIGTDGNGATLQLLDPWVGNYTAGATATYKIYIRALGKPGGWANITSGFVDETGQYWYSLESVIVTRSKGQSRFSDKTLELTTIYVDITDDGIDNPVRYGLFDSELYDYFWQYDNHGLKLLQMRFYLTS